MKRAKKTGRRERKRGKVAGETQGGRQSIGGEKRAQGQKRERRVLGS